VLREWELMFEGGRATFCFALELEVESMAGLTRFFGKMGGVKGQNSGVGARVMFDYYGWKILAPVSKPHPIVSAAGESLSSLICPKL
jgi:extradiol dioxygenase family protein